MELFIKDLNYLELNGSDLAYVGDAYYELYIRLYLLSKGYRKPQELHKLGEFYVSAAAHSKIMKNLYEQLSEVELSIFKRGRNYSYKHRPKNAKLSEYLMSSGFEALIGYLYLSKNTIRLDEIMNMSIKIIEEQI